jgi:hypothetical protein
LGAAQSAEPLGAWMAAAESEATEPAGDSRAYLVPTIVTPEQPDARQGLISHGAISRTQADLLLNADGEAGAFLLRDKGEGTVALSHVTTDRKLMHQLITARGDGGVFCLNGEPCGGAASLEACIAYLQQTWKFPLTHPIQPLVSETGGL